jgi:hypothetical protein
VTKDAFILLPQTAIRFWGIPNSELINYHQVQIPIRSKNDEKFADSYYLLNSKILSISNSNPINFVEINHLHEAIKQGDLVDCQILNISHHYPKFYAKNKFEIVDYSSLGNRSLLFTDLNFPKQAIRSALRNFKLKKSFSPKTIWHWDDYALSQRNRLIKFGWENRFIETKKVKLQSIKFLEVNAGIFPELSAFSNFEDIMLIAPEIGTEAEDLKEQVRNLLSFKLDFSEKFYNTYNILIKQHKSCHIKYPSEVNIAGKKCVVANSEMLRALPIEILLFGFTNSFIVTSPSSSIFSNSFASSILLPVRDSNYHKEYGLMIKRHKLHVDKDKLNNF